MRGGQLVGEGRVRSRDPSFTAMISKVSAIAAGCERAWTSPSILLLVCVAGKKNDSWGTRALGRTTRSSDRRPAADDPVSMPRVEPVDELEDVRSRHPGYLRRFETDNIARAGRAFASITS